MGKEYLHLWMLAQSEIRSLVAQDELGKASDLLLEITEVFRRPNHDEAIVIAGRVRKLLKEQRLGLFDYQTLTEESSRLSLSIIKLMELA
jgi:hypothetical protein